ncbi:MAG: hypothetical protein J1E60_07100 [Christensenellaceae bacterium]|nr:hypothetical protein [Christensenellaceae bacterium]
MNPGKLNKWMGIFAYRDGEWRLQRHVYCACKYLPRVIFSPLAQARDGAEVKIRRTNIDKRFALLIEGRFHLIASVDYTDKAYLTLTAARVVPELITGERTVSRQGRLNRPENVSISIEPFCGVISEKYLNHAQQLPNAVLENGLILTTPKCVKLKSGDTLVHSGKRYSVLTAHTEDEYINDYEIVRMEDA